MNTMTKRGILGYIYTLKSTKENQGPVISWLSLTQKREGNIWYGIFKIKPDTEPNLSGIFGLLPDEYLCRSLALYDGLLTITIEINEL